MSAASQQILRAPSQRLDGRRALISGAGRGVGFACASALASAGAMVVMTGRSGEQLKEAAAAIAASGGNTQAVTLDVCDVPSTSRWVADQAPFDILVNNAGTNRPGPFLQACAADFDTVFGVNVRAGYFLAQAVACRLVAVAKPGSIINISSQLGHIGFAKRSIYCASKHAVEGMTKAMAAELGRHGIRVNSLCPTFIETSLTRSCLSEPACRESVLNRIRLGRLGTLEDVMGAVVFLSSDASALMTGSALMLDGGWTTS